MNEQYKSILSNENIEEKTIYLNEIIQAYGNSEILLSYTDVEYILKIVHELEELEKRGITSDTFSNKKVKAFHGNLKKMEKEFGYKPINKNLPFNRPSDLKIKIDMILSNLGLNDEQIREVTKELFHDESRRPKEKFIEPLFTVESTQDGKIKLNKTKYITPLRKKEHYSNIPKTDEKNLRIDIELTKQEYLLLKEFVTKEYGDYYVNDPQLYLQDTFQNIVKQFIKDLQ